MKHTRARTRLVPQGPTGAQVLAEVLTVPMYVSTVVRAGSPQAAVAGSTPGLGLLAACLPVFPDSPSLNKGH